MDIHRVLMHTHQCLMLEARLGHLRAVHHGLAHHPWTRIPFSCLATHQISHPIHTPPSPPSFNSHLSSHPVRRTSPVSSSPISAPSIAHPTVSWSRHRHLFPDRPWPEPARTTIWRARLLQIPQIQEAASANGPAAAMLQCCNAELARPAAVMLRLFLARFQLARGPPGSAACQPTGAGNCACCVEMCRRRRAQRLFCPTPFLCCVFLELSASDEPGLARPTELFRSPLFPPAPPAPAKPGVEG